MARVRFSQHCSDPARHSSDCDCLWIEEQLKKIPVALHQIVHARIKNISNRRERNTYLLKLANDSFASKFSIPPFAWTNDDNTKTEVDISNYASASQLVALSDSDICDLADMIASNEAIWTYKAPQALHHHRLAPRLRRYLRKHAGQAKEMWAYDLNLVSASKNQIVSDMTLRRRKDQKNAQADWSSRTTVTTADGKKLSMSDLQTQQKKNRAAEIYAVLRGAEAEAKKAGLTALFITLTAPPRFHQNPSSGKKSWDGSTPEQAQKWLMKEWSRKRALLAKAGITLSGVRVAEGHQDGCPHLHILAFVEHDHIDKIKEALENTEGWDKEAGAKIVEIKTGKGSASAASYAMKYVMKTLFAKEEETDRNDAWRATWSIRAIQFFGLPYMNVWRTLREARAEEITDPTTCAARAAACGNRYDVFLEIMRGLGIKQNERPIRVQTTNDPESLMKIKQIFCSDMLALVLAKAKAIIETIAKIKKVTVIDSHPRKAESQNPKTENLAFPPPATAPPLTDFTFA